MRSYLSMHTAAATQKGLLCLWGPKSVLHASGLEIAARRMQLYLSMSSIICYILCMNVALGTFEINWAEKILNVGIGSFCVCIEE